MQESLLLNTIKSNYSVSGPDVMVQNFNILRNINLASSV